MREGAGPEAFARVVETDRPLKKRGHSGDDKKADKISEEIRRTDDLIWATARQLRDQYWVIRFYIVWITIYMCD